MRTAIFYLLLIIAVPATAQIYSYTDAQGHRVYSDQPPANTRSQALEPQPANGAQPHAATPEPRATPQPPAPGPSYTQLQLAGLPSDGAVRANNGSFSVHVLLSPGLQAPHQLRLLLDDQPYGPPGKTTELQLVNLDRGEHRLAVQVLDGEQLVQQSPTLSFNLLRVHRP